MQSNRALSILTIFILLTFFLPSLFQKGMFLDGITYATISRNMALGLGEFWSPVYTETFGDTFHAHPPLVFWIQSIFFFVFGDFFWIERIYGLVICLLSAGGILKIWNLMAFKKTNVGGWLPVLIWIMIPMVSWSYTNNILENTMALFDLWAVYFLCLAIKKENLHFLFIGSVLAFLAVFSKGLPGLFPIAVLWIYVLIFSVSCQRHLLHFLGPFVIILTLFWILIFFFPQAQLYFSEYLKTQLLPAFSGTGEVTVSNRFYILARLGLQLIIPFLLVIASIFYMKKWIPNMSNSSLNQSLFFLIIALCDCNGSI